ncbi:MAG: hypothetical protein A2741_01075 [Candidatus Zambryskibacteria bacterium RIFCSPHIGHO2_01_FULL_43_27]|uniref:Uncharacterized protein n=1 Tax=Candidatus Zambryskibacteria bacterium RIFCSPLOWO2_01_FULL_43_17 TaxID=1802760 RepID=A0A1G2U553_9BACT|nr:MAG: hypothetical protein A2741_01075 [Candidatus Zambryskibacteria bacterium RIFCSPHIGHO2_01_FULL_43_27]OHB00093.1 MAG: hypothetical protein A3E93_02070 [Candidatus Zambryskibacteria bacterium RIFCSPHIGHO2_12_FULL_43_12b]OHB04624.1 MAG: hypothetical protein A2920_01655 [Candidatus Zambryskibacteria bacterium RIFCSPLOWO2_01_FULL_43_17]
MDNDKKNPLNLDDDKIREIERKMSQSSNVAERQSGAFEGVNIAFPKEMGMPKEVEAKRAPEANQASTVQRSETAIKNLRTFQGDVAEAIKSQNASVLTIALAEKKRQDNVTNQAPTSPAQVKSARKPLDSETKRNIILGVISVMLIISGVGAVYGFYILQKKDGITVEALQKKPLLGWSNRATVDIGSIKNGTLVEKINEFRENATIGNGEIFHLNIEKAVPEGVRPISTSEFFKILDTKAPAPLLRSFKQDFMFGFFGLSDSREPFLLIELDSFDLAFSGMLAWEKVLNEDIGSLFTRRVVTVKEVLPDPTASSSLISTSTAQTQTRIINFDNPNPAGFEDVTIRNKDARMLTNIRGETILLYSFIDRKFLLITSNENVLREIVNKLIAEQSIR